MIKAVLFDLDGTLLPNNEKEFAFLYLDHFGQAMTKYGYEKSKFINGMNYAAKTMISYLNGDKSEEEIFFEAFNEYVGKDIRKDLDKVEQYYLNEYKYSFSALGKDPYALKCLKECRKKGLKIILASNPLFPKIAYVERAKYNDLSPSYFDEITSYDLYHYTKPNQNYYQEILDRNHLGAEEVIYFGNEPKLDIIPAESIGIKAYLVHGDNGISSKQMLEIIKTLNLN